MSGVRTVEAKLVFDLEELERFSAKVAEIQEDLQNLQTTIRTEMETLKAGWNTPAGREFFEKQEYEWAEEVKKYVAILETLHEMIAFAHTQYTEVKETGEKISI